MPHSPILSLIRATVFINGSLQMVFFWPLVCATLNILDFKILTGKRA